MFMFLSSVTIFADRGKNQLYEKIISYDFNYKLVNIDIARIRTLSEYPTIHAAKDFDIAEGELPSWVYADFFEISKYLFNSKSEFKLIKCKANTEYLGNKQICIGELNSFGISTLTEKPEQNVIDIVRWVLLHEISHYLVDLSAITSTTKATPNGILDPIIDEERFNILSEDEFLFHNISGHTEMDIYAFIILKQLGWNYPKQLIKRFNHYINCEHLIDKVELAYKETMLMQCELAKAQRIHNAERAQKLFQSEF